MTFRTNPGPDEPQHGDAARDDLTDDPDSPYRYGDPGRQQAGDPAAGAGAEAGGGGRATIGAGSPSQWQPGYEPLGHRSPGAHRASDRPSGRGPGHAAPGYQAPGYQAPGPAGSGVASRNGRAVGYQPPGAADMVSDGYNADEFDADHQHAGGAAAADGMWEFPNGTQPEPGQPEFGLYGPPAAEASPSGVSASTGDSPHRADRGRHGRRIWLGVGAVLVIVVAAAALLVGRLGHSGQAAQPAAAPSHTLATPQKIGTYTRDQQAEQQLGLSHGEQYLTQIDPGHVAGIVAAIYDTGGPASSPDRVAVMAGRLVKSPLTDVIKSFTQQETAEGNAPVRVAAGLLGGQAACAGKGGSGICVWADRDTVGVLVSATINASSLARMMLTIRSGVEFLAA